MKWHKAVLDISTRLVHLSSPVYGKVTPHLPTISSIKASLHHVVERKIEEIHVVREFTDVLPNDQGIKVPYKMTREELAELKIQLKDLLRLHEAKLITLGYSNIVCAEESDVLHLCVDYQP
jgi:translation initiation factor 6 (eIF-6)